MDTNTRNNTVTAILERVRITDVAAVHGVKLDRSGRRGVATWRNGKNFSVSFNDSKGVWHDFVTHEGGGILDFVERVRGWDRRSALEWLASYAGVSLDKPTEASRRDWARRMREAEPEARRLVTWKFAALAELRGKRNLLQKTYHCAIRFVLSQDAWECERHGDWRYELAMGIGETYWSRVEELDLQIDQLEAATYVDLVLRFRGRDVV